MRIFTLCLFLSLLSVTLTAQGGMWLPQYIAQQNEKDMKALGLKLKATDLYAEDKPSVKDAICLFGAGCTAGIVSPQGLVFTNHHCGFDAIQKLSTLQHNYIEDGYWAATAKDELPCAGLTITFIARIEEVTAQALQGVTATLSESERQSQIDKNLAQIKANTKRETWEDVMFRPFYSGNQYYLYVVATYRDIRLVGTPPSSIGKFGSDTDNWVWPRHTGDFSVFRVYADKDNRPAPYAPDNKPYVPKHYLPVSLNGVEEGDFMMVYGFPGVTNEYLPAVAVQQTAEVSNPARIAVRDRTLKILDGYMRQDPAVKIAYVSKYAGIANAWKKWQGENIGLKAFDAVGKKRAYEADFTRRLQNNAVWQQNYGQLLPQLTQNYQAIEPYARARDYYLEIFVRDNELMARVANLNSWLKENEANFSARLAANGAALDAFYKDYHPKVDEQVFAALMEMYAQKVSDEWGSAYIQQEVKRHGSYTALASYIYQNSLLANAEKKRALWAEPASQVAAKLNADPAVVFWRGVTDAYQANVAPKLQTFQPTLTQLQRQYMAAQMAVFPEKRFFPDANSTLRLTYGLARSYRPRDGVQYEYRTYLDGVMEKYIPGDYEFDVPKKLVALWKAKDYGRYADAQGRMPVAFIGSNHTTGGNSGSPALDAQGNLIGLNFDRVWEGTMSDLHYEPAICRNIMVDTRYVLFIIDKLGGAQRLIQEMTLVQGGKKGKKR